MNNTITIELCAEDRARLDAILEALQGVKPNCHSCVQSTIEQTKYLAEQAETARGAQPAQETTTPNTSHPVDEVSPHGQPEPVAEPEPGESHPDEIPEVVASTHKWTKEDLQARVQALAAPGTGKTAQVRAIVKSYAERVGLIPEDKYDEFMDKLTALEQEG